MSLPDKLKNYNLYHLLDVETFSDTRKIKKGYRNLALKHHPDRFPTDENSALKFELGTAAYRFLLNRGNQFSYDQMLRSRAQKTSSFKNREFALQRRKTSTASPKIHSEKTMLGENFANFVGNCRSDFQNFLKAIPRVQGKLRETRPAR